MNRDAIFSTNEISPKQQQSPATKLQISPMSPLNIQTLKNGFIESNDLSSSNHHHPHQNGHILLQPKQILTQPTISNNSIQVAYNAPNTVIYPNGLIDGSIGNNAQQTPPVDNMFLHRIIAKDVNHPRTSRIAEKSVDSRNTVVKKAPGGTVQITYKNMINVSASANNDVKHTNNNPVFILPKPMNGFHHQQHTLDNSLPNYNTKHQQQNHINYSHSSNTAIPFNNHTNYMNSASSTQVSKSLNELNSRPIASWVPSVSGDAEKTDNGDLSVGLETPLMEGAKLGTSNQLYSEQLTDDLINTSTSNNINPFSGIDIDLSCLDTDSFDSIQLQQFYQNGMNEEIVTMATSEPMNTLTTSTIDAGGLCKQVASCDTEIPMVVDVVSSNDLIYEQIDCSDRNEVELKSIIDVSPEMAVSTGGIKIILIGSWNAKDARYQCRFGSCTVQSELIQNGVLRCYSPKHKPGVVKLTVLCDNQVISKDVDFTFVESSDKSSQVKVDHGEWLSISDKSLIHLLVARISFIAFVLTGEELSTVHQTNLEADESQVENKLIDICKTLMTMSANLIDFDYQMERMMTVLHLSSALGYIKLIQLLMNWVESNPNKIIQAEASPTSVDQYSLIPIMWSSAKGHFNTTCVLHQWAESTIEEKDACGCTALSLATENGHSSLVEYLGRLLKKSTISRENSMNQEACSLSQNLCMTPSSYPNPNSVISTVSSLSKEDDSSPRTLGKTLAFIQSMLNDQDDDDVQDAEDEENRSLFTPPDFVHTRQRSITDESIASSSQHSPASPAQTALQSPFNRQAKDTAEFYEFFYKAKKIEKDFAELTLTDQEQEELYRAANVIQTAYKSYKERRKLRDQEFSSATLIQSYYRRYKQYAAFKKMQKGAVLIQNQYRAHREKAKKKSEAASLIQTYYRKYRQRKYGNTEHNSVQEKNKLEQQAGRKVNRYLKQTTKRFSREFPDEFNISTLSCESFKEKTG